MSFIFQDSYRNEKKRTENISLVSFSKEKVKIFCGEKKGNKRKSISNTDLGLNKELSRIRLKQTILFAFYHNSIFLIFTFIKINIVHTRKYEIFHFSMQYHFWGTEFNSMLLMLGSLWAKKNKLCNLKITKIWLQNYC